MITIQFCNTSNFTIYCEITAIYQPLCRNILQKFARAIYDILYYAAMYYNTIYCPPPCMLYID